MGQLEEPDLRLKYSKEILLAKVKEYEDVSEQLNIINYHLRAAHFKVEENTKSEQEDKKKLLEKRRDRIFKERILRWTIISNIPCDYYCKKIQFQDSHKEIGKRVPAWDETNQF